MRLFGAGVSLLARSPPITILLDDLSGATALLAGSGDTCHPAGRARTAASRAGNEPSRARLGAARWVDEPSLARLGPLASSFSRLGSARRRLASQLAPAHEPAHSSTSPVFPFPLMLLPLAHCSTATRIRPRAHLLLRFFPPSTPADAADGSACNGGAAEWPAMPEAEGAGAWRGGRRCRREAGPGARLMAAAGWRG